VSNQTPHQGADGVGAGQTDPLVHNPYAAQYQQASAPDLDAGAPMLRSNELRRMNRRALAMLGSAVVVLLFVSYWMISSAASRSQPKRPREEKVTIVDAPPTLALPPSRPSQARPIALMQQPALPPLPPAPAQPGPADLMTPVPLASATHRPTLVERRIAGANEAAGDLPGLSPQVTAQDTSGSPLLGHPKVATARSLEHADSLMQRGTYVRCVLETRIVTDVPGYTSCLVTEPVYSFNGRKLLLPKGSKVLGAYSGGPTGHRVAVVWDRIITPTGIDVDMSGKPSPGIDNLGGAGLPGYYDAHWGQRIGAALLISMLSDGFKYEAAEHGPRTSAIAGNGVVVQEPFQSNTARTIENLADQAVREAANRRPTVTINQGTVIYVYVAQDVDFSDVVARF
jgi:type IV secretion system protein VirB10